MTEKIICNIQENKDIERKSGDQKVKIQTANTFVEIAQFC